MGRYPHFQPCSLKQTLVLAKAEGLGCSQLTPLLPKPSQTLTAQASSNGNKCPECSWHNALEVTEGLVFAVASLQAAILL